MAHGISRRRLLGAAAAAGLVPLAAACGERAPTEPALPSASAAADEPGGNTLGRDVLAQGLMALAHAHKRGWARGHHGAAVIASYYFCLEHPLDEPTLHALRGQVESFVQYRRAEFPGLDPGPGNADVGPVLEQLEAHVHELRSGGHDAIYASLALRALQDLPHYATPKVIDGLRRLLVSFVETLPVTEATEWQREHPAEPYADSAALARETLDAMQRPWESVLELGAGQVVHWVTHADALVTLDELGHGAIARKAWPAHRRYIHHPLGDGTGSGPSKAAIDWLSAEYWEGKAPRQPQKGSWFFGHTFKLPYSLFRLLRGVEDEAVRRACLVRGAQLSVPFT